MCNGLRESRFKPLVKGVVFFNIRLPLHEFCVHLLHYQLGGVVCPKQCDQDQPQPCVVPPCRVQAGRQGDTIWNRHYGNIG